MTKSAVAEKLPSAEQPKRNPIKRSGDKVTIASKLPMSITIFLCSSRKEVRRFQGSVWEEEVKYPIPETIHVIRGFAFPNGEIPEEMQDSRPEMASGYALTHGVDKDFFEQWLIDNAETQIVQNRLVFMASNGNEARAIAKDLKHVNSMLGPIRRGKDSAGNDMIDDPRVQKKIKGTIGVVSTDSRPGA